MSLEKNKEIILRLNEAFNKNDWDLLDDLISPEYFDHTSQLKGLEPMKQRMKIGRLAFSEYHKISLLIKNNFLPRIICF